MAQSRIIYSNIDDYIASFPEGTRIVLQKVRSTIREAAPEAEETMSYGMPTFTLSGNLVHFAAFKNHIGFYPTPSGISTFINELSEYKNAKGSVQFPLSETLPLELISRIVKFRVEENQAKAKKSGKKRAW